MLSSIELGAGWMQARRRSSQHGRLLLSCSPPTGWSVAAGRRHAQVRPRPAHCICCQRSSWLVHNCKSCSMSSNTVHFTFGVAVCAVLMHCVVQQLCLACVAWQHLWITLAVASVSCSVVIDNNSCLKVLSCVSAVCSICSRVFFSLSKLSCPATLFQS